jgi:16S rRNA C967 or C1407 C5-methylase (RsmB/RsmF family)
VQPPRQLPWYPDGLAWQIDVSRGQLRKVPALARAHAFLVQANETGAVTRQEAVSMVPPLFLDVQPHHLVLDMCAAPGSKTVQLVEALHAVPRAEGDGTSSAAATVGAARGAAACPPGLVVANDADAQRCNLLVHQTKRMCSPCLIVTHHGGEQFPSVAAPAAVAAVAARAVAANGNGTTTTPLAPSADAQGCVFDRVLCDVPCSGDGTMRKAPDIWRRWSCGNGNGLHVTQLRIALQGARLLKAGGRMVYSTCTFNPIENEAVVAELLRRSKGCLRLVDVSSALPALKRGPGLKTWRVRDRHQWYGSWAEARPIAYKLDPSMFPPEDVTARGGGGGGGGEGGKASSGPTAEELLLERCMRFLPHAQDTGGFFVCVLEKVGPCPPGGLMDPDMGHRFKQGTNKQKEQRAAAAAAAAAAAEEGGAADGAPTDPDGDGLPPLDPTENARFAAEYAVRAAERAFDALGGGDLDAAVRAVSQAEAAESRARLASEAVAEQAKAAASQAALEESRRLRDEQRQKRRQEQEAAAEGAMDVDGGGGGDDQDAAAQRPPSSAAGGNNKNNSNDKKAAAAAAAADKAAAAPGAAGSAPSWVRGGGRRGLAPGAAPSNGGGGQGRGGTDPILPVEDSRVLEPLISFYGFDAPKEGGGAFGAIRTHMVTRSVEGAGAMPKRVYFLSDAALGLLLADEKEALRVTAAGLKVFDRQELRGGAKGGPCCYRISQEGLPFVLPHVTRQVLRLNAEDFARLLTERNLLTPPGALHPEDPGPGGGGEGGEEGDDAAGDGGDDDNDAAKKAAQIAQGAATVVRNKDRLLDSPYAVEQLKRMHVGGAVVALDSAAAAELGMAGDEAAAAAEGNAAHAPMAICVWRTRASVGALATKTECLAMLDKLTRAKAEMEARKNGSGGAVAAVAAAVEEPALAAA